PFARCATADPRTIATASCHARRRRRASERESHTRAMPKASAPQRATAGTPGGSTPSTRSKRFAISGVSADAMPITPTAAAAQASSDSGFGFLRGTRPGYNLSMPVPRWITALLSLAAIGLVPWTLWLTFSLPSRRVSHHYDIAWVGFDIGLAAAFGATAWAALRASTWLLPLAAVTGTMLLCDAKLELVDLVARDEVQLVDERPQRAERLLREPRPTAAQTCRQLDEELLDDVGDALATARDHAASCGGAACASRGVPARPAP